MMKMMVTGMVVAAGESLRMTSSGQPFACEDRAGRPDSGGARSSHGVDLSAAFHFGHHPVPSLSSHQNQVDNLKSPSVAI